MVRVTSWFPNWPRNLSAGCGTVPGVVSVEVLDHSEPTGPGPSKSLEYICISAKAGARKTNKKQIVAGIIEVEILSIIGLPFLTLSVKIITVDGVSVKEEMDAKEGKDGYRETPRINLGAKRKIDYR